MVATPTQQQPMLTKAQVELYVAQKAPQLGLDPAAVLAVASHEGLNATPGSTWSDPPGFAFGPPSWNSAGLGAAIISGGPGVPAQGKDAAAWSWSQQGIDYWLDQVASVAGGRTGADAISHIVNGFEHPSNPTKEISDSIAVYPQFQALIGGSTPIPGTLPPSIPIPIPGTTDVPIAPITTTDPTQAPAPSASSPFSLQLFKLPTGPVDMTLPWSFSGIVLFLMAIFAIIIGALMWDKSRNVIVKTSETAAIAAA